MREPVLAHREPHARPARSRHVAALMNDRDQAIAHAISGAFLAGPWDPPTMVRRAGRTLGDRRIVWLRTLADLAVHAFPTPPHDAPRELRSVLLASGIIRQQRFTDEHARRPPLRLSFAASPTQMGPTPWPVPELHSVGELADHLGLAAGQLQWFADVRSWERIVADEPLRQYRYRWMSSSSGSRLIEAPKGTLRHIQRVLLRTILDEIPIHDAAHGFATGRSIHGFIAPHVGASMLVKADLQAFFNSIRAGRVYALWRRMGYPEPVAHVLTGLVTNAVPSAVLRRSPTPNSHLAALLRGPHLPQGAPTSPALANLLAFHLDVRLNALAASFGAVYTRYADDLAFSGLTSLRRRPTALLRLTDEIARDEGFRLNPLKTAILGPGQRHRLGGVVINTRPNVDRRDYDQLKAEIHDAVINGPAAANRRGVAHLRAHLLGRISWVAELNPSRAERLRDSFERIVWPKTTNA